MSEVLRVDAGVRLGALDLSVRLETRALRIAIEGPSGSGKTTTLRVIAGVEREARGSVSFRGDRWLDPSGAATPAWARRVGWVPQDACVFPHLDVRENLSFAGATPDEVRRVAELVEVGPLLDRRVGALSGGERQRVAIARALLARPRLLLLDEPFTALDRPLRARLAESLRALSEAEDLAIVLASHDADAITALATERWVIAGGRVAPATD
jgi:molybdate transport system ATP-binding protein